MTLIERPSPGVMTEGLEDDPVDAWQDYFEAKSKRRITNDHARAKVLRAWSIWDGDKTTGEPMFRFFPWLGRRRPYFLTFRTKRDPWQTMHSGLIQHEDRHSENESERRTMN